MVSCACVPYNLVIQKVAVQFGSMRTPVQSYRITSMTPVLKEDNVIGSNECKSVISTRSGLSVSRSFYYMAVNAVARDLVLKYTLYVCVLLEKSRLIR